MATSMKKLANGDWVGYYRTVNGGTRKTNLGPGKDCAREKLERIVVAEGRLINFPSDSLWHDLLSSYAKYLMLQGNAVSYVREAVNILGRVVVEYGMKEGRDFDFKRCSRFLADMRERGRSAATINHRIVTLTNFSKWLVAEREADTVVQLKRVKRDAEPTFRRRVLSIEEEKKLNSYLATAPFKSLCGCLPGLRGMIYAVALGTGYRASELSAMQWGDYLGGERNSPSFIRLPARYTKNKKPAHQPIQERLSAYLAACSRSDEEPMFPGWVSKRAGHMLRTDLERAGVMCDTDEGKIDFHSLRHTYITRLVQAGVPVAVVQKLARHANVQTTLSYYVHLDGGDLASAVERLP